MKHFERLYKMIMEDSNPDVQDQADVLNAYIEATDDEIDWEYAGDYELDADLNTCLFYNDKSADDAWPIGDFATTEWDEEEDDYVYRDSEEVFRDAYEYKFNYGNIFYVADELMDMVEKYGEGNPVFDEVKNIVEADPDIVYEDYDCDDEDYVNLVHQIINGLGTIKDKMSDLDTVKFDVLCNLTKWYA